MRDARVERRYGDAGLVRVELAVIMLVVVIAAGVILVTGSAFVHQGQQTACRQDYQRIAAAEEAYYAGRSPASYALLTGPSSPLITTGVLHSVSRWYRVTVADAHRYAILPVGDTCTAPPS